jgi:hypothetical protein
MVAKQNAPTYLRLDPTFGICFVVQDLLVSLMFLMMDMLGSKTSFFFLIHLRSIHQLFSYTF